MNMLGIVHQYAYFFSLVFFILPVSIAFDAATGFAVVKKIATLRGVLFIGLSVLFWSAYDVLWVHALGSFPSNRILGTVGGVPIEEMLLFALAFYNIGAIFAWCKHKFP